MNTFLISIRRSAAALALASVCALGVTACASDAPVSPAADATTSNTDAAVGHQENGATVTVTDPWIKATDGHMTGVFGTIKNNSDAPLTIEAVDFDGAGKVELHETVIGQDGSSVMQPAEGGFTIPAGGEFKLEPGANHIMLMDLSKPIEVGASYDLTIHFNDGSTTTMTAIAKEYTGAQESYAPDGSLTNGGHGDMSGHEGHDDMSGHGGHGDMSGHDGHGDMASETPAS